MAGSPQSAGKDGGDAPRATGEASRAFEAWMERRTRLPWNCQNRTRLPWRSLANLTAIRPDMGVDIRRVFGEIWSIQAQSFPHLYDNESGEYEVWIGAIDPEHPFAEWRGQRRSDSVVVLTEMAKIALPLLVRELE